MINEGVFMRWDDAIPWFLSLVAVGACALGLW